MLGRLTRVKPTMVRSTKAFEIVRDTIGEKPVEKVAVTTPLSETISKVEDALFGGKNDK